VSLEKLANFFFQFLRKLYTSSSSLYLHVSVIGWAVSSVRGRVIVLIVRRVCKLVLRCPFAKSHSDSHHTIKIGDGYHKILREDRNTSPLKRDLYACTHHSRSGEAGQSPGQQAALPPSTCVCSPACTIRSSSQNQEGRAHRRPNQNCTAVD
jgi:hypothetical protein